MRLSNKECITHLLQGPGSAVPKRLKQLKGPCRCAAAAYYQKKRALPLTYNIMEGKRYRYT